MNIAPYFNSALLATKQTAFVGYAQVATVSISNPNAALSYVQLFDALAANVTVGTTPPTAVIALAANGAVNGTLSLKVNTGLVVAASTTATGNTPPATAGLPVTLFFQ